MKHGACKIIVYTPNATEINKPAAHRHNSGQFNHCRNNNLPAWPMWSYRISARHISVRHITLRSSPAENAIVMMEMIPSVYTVSAGCCHCQQSTLSKPTITLMNVLRSLDMQLDKCFYGNHFQIFKKSLFAFCILHECIHWCRAYLVRIGSDGQLTVFS